MPGDGKCEESEVNGGHVRPTQKNKMIGKKLVMSEFLIRQNVFFSDSSKMVGHKMSWKQMAGRKSAHKHQRPTRRLVTPKVIV